jgi:hypothetical protein
MKYTQMYYDYKMTDDCLMNAWWMPDDRLW